MARFMDFHPDLKLPKEAVQMFADAAKTGERDKHDCRVLEVYYNADGKVYCFLEAPSAEAVVRHHHDLGVPCGEVHEIKSLL